MDDEGTIRVVVLGDGGVGKSSLVIRYVHGQWVEEYDPTIEDWYRKTAIVDGTTSTLGILDSAGQEEFSAMKDMYTREAHVLLMCYAADGRQSFESLETFLEGAMRVREADEMSELPVVIAQTRDDVDKAQHEVAAAEGKDFATSRGFPFVSTSAKGSHNVDEVFAMCVRVYREHSEGKAAVQATQGGAGVFSCCQRDGTDEDEQTDNESHSSSHSALAALKGRRLKVVVLGGGGVGKSALVVQYIHNHFVAEYDPTIEDTYTKHLSYDGHEVVMDILDTAGQEEFSTMKDNYIREADVLVLCFSLGSRSSMDEVDSFVSSACRTRDQEASELPLVVVLTKDDLDEHHWQIMPQEARDVANAYEAPFVSTSAKNGTGVEEVFEAAVQRYVECEEGVTVDRGGGSGWLACCKANDKEEEAEEEEEDKGPGDQHTDAIWKVATCDELMISCSRDGDTRVWEAQTSTLVHTLRYHTSLVYCMAVLPHRQLLTGSDDGSVCHWDLDSGENLGVYACGAGVTGVGLFKGLIVACAKDNQVHTFDSPTNKHSMRVVEAPVEINEMLIVDDEVWLACSDNNIHVLQLQPLERVRVLSQHSNYVLHLCSDGKAVYSAGADKKAVMWTKGGQVNQEFVGHKDWINSIHAQDGLLFTGSRDKTVRVWDTLTGKCMFVGEGHTNTVRSIVVDAEHGVLFSAGKDKSVRAWDYRTGTAKWDIEGHGDWINALCVHDGLVISGSRDTTLRGWNIDDGVIRRVYGNTAARLKGLLVPKIQEALGVVALLVDFLQLTSFAFSADLPFQEDHPAQETKTFQFDFDFGSLSFSALFWAVWACVVATLALFLNAKRVASKKSNSSVYAKLWLLTWLMCWLMAGPGFIPVMRILLTPLDCATARLVCGSGEHVAMIVMSMATMAPFLALMVRLAGVGGDLNKVAVYFPWTWKFDKPETRKVHLFSRRSVKFARAFLLIKVLMLLTAMFLVSVPSLLASALLVSSLVVYVCTVLWPPFHDLRVNSSRGALLFGVVWTNVMAIVVVVINDRFDATPTTVHLVVEPVMVLVGGLCMWMRLRWEKKKEAAELQRKQEALEDARVEVVELDRV